MNVPEEGPVSGPVWTLLSRFGQRKQLGLVACCGANIPV